MRILSDSEALALAFLKIAPNLLLNRSSDKLSILFCAASAKLNFFYDSIALSIATL
jgi:hypothetical protein